MYTPHTWQRSPSNIASATSPTLISSIPGYLFVIRAHLDHHHARNALSGVAGVADEVRAGALDQLPVELAALGE
jgi:hypothetical protein